jgi:hypothetical protein
MRTAAAKHHEVGGEGLYVGRFGCRRAIGKNYVNTDLATSTCLNREYAEKLPIGPNGPMGREVGCRGLISFSTAQHVARLQTEYGQDGIFHGEIDDFIKGNGYSPPAAPMRNNVVFETRECISLKPTPALFLTTPATSAVSSKFQTGKSRIRLRLS